MLGFASGKPHMQDVVFNRTRLLSSQDCGVSSLEHLSLPLPAAQTFAPGAGEKNTFSPAGGTVVAAAAAKNPFWCPGRPG